MIYLDLLTVPGMALGHEGAGIVEAIGPAVQSIKVGNRVGFGYIHKICGRCENCLTGNPLNKLNSLQVSNKILGKDVYCIDKKEFGSHDHDLGSFGSNTVWDADALYVLPNGLDSAHAAPLMCGGATVWSALSLYGLKATDRVGVVGIGGL